MLRALGRAGGKVTPRDPGPLARTVASTATLTRTDYAESRITLGALEIPRSQYASAWRSRQPSEQEDPDLGASLSRLLARAHEALSRNAIDLAPVACLPAFGFGIPGSSC